ncbi:MAG TPA: hypothetical protein DIW36_09070 [Ruminococcaceae bacterium]|nr:hypothetical protein [Oscillospiraceae bacterium]
MDLLFRLFVIGFAIGVCGLACAYGANQAVQDMARKIVTPVLQDNKRLTDCLTDGEKELKALRQAYFEVKAENVLLKEKNPPSRN